MDEISQDTKILRRFFNKSNILSLFRKKNQMHLNIKGKENKNCFLKRSKNLRKRFNPQNAYVQKKSNFEETIAINLSLSSYHYQFKVTKFTPYSQLITLLSRTASRRQGKSVIGFETKDKNYLVDFQLQNRVGVTLETLNLVCLYKEYFNGIQKYNICKYLQESGHGKIFLLRSKNNCEFYMAKFISKQIKKNKNELQLMLNDKYFLSFLASEFLVKFYEFYETLSFYVIVMEHCHGGKLFHFLKTVPILQQHQAQFYIIEILLALDHLHKRQISFLNLNPQTIFIDHHGHVKINDFRYAKKSKDKNTFPHEDVNGDFNHLKMIDFFCIGALLYQMLLGFPICQNQLKPSEITEFIQFSHVIFPPFAKLGEEVQNLILKLTQKEETQRLGWNGGISQILLHPWFEGIKLSSYIQKRVQPPFKPCLNTFNFNEDLHDVGRVFQERIHVQLKLLQENAEKKSLLKRKSFSVTRLSPAGRSLCTSLKLKNADNFQAEQQSDLPKKLSLNVRNSNFGKKDNKQRIKKKFQKHQKTKNQVLLKRGSILLKK